MIPNFNRVEMGNGNRSISDNDRHSDRIDSRWSPMVTSSLDNEMLMLPPTNSSIPALQEQLAMLRKERARLSASYEQGSQSFLPTPVCPGNSSSPTSVMDVKRLKDPVDSTREETVAFSKQSCNYAKPFPTTKGQQNQNHQYQPFGNQHQLKQQPTHNPHHYNSQNSTAQQQQQYNSQQNHQQRAIQFECLHPRDDRRSRVRFSQALSVYDNFEAFDYSDGSSPPITNRETSDIASPSIKNRKTLNKEQDHTKLSFMLHRARYCWYSRDELKKIKSERKVIVRELRKVNFDVRSIDPSVYELRGLEAYLSPEILRTTLTKRKEVLEVVFNEQNRQRQFEGGKRNAEGIQLASLRASEWFRTRAREFAEKDAKEAQALYLSDPEVMNLLHRLNASGKVSTKSFHSQQGAADQGISMAYERMNDSIGLMDIDDENAGSACLNDSTLSFWANSSWTKDLMEE